MRMMGYGNYSSFGGARGISRPLGNFTGAIYPRPCANTTGGTISVETTSTQPQTTDDGDLSGKRLRLPDLPDYKLGTEGDIDPFHASDEAFLQFAASLVPLQGEGLDHWTWEERRDFLNWCLDEQVLVIVAGRLVPNALLEGECSE